MFSEASDETVVVLFELPLDELTELLVALDEAVVDALEELAVPAVGWNVWLLGPKPTTGANVPPTVTVSFISLFLPAITSLPLPLIEAVT